MKRVFSFLFVIIFALVICSCGSPDKKLNTMESLSPYIGTDYKQFPFYDTSSSDIEIVDETNNSVTIISDKYTIAGMPDTAEKIQLEFDDGLITSIRIYYRTEENMKYLLKYFKENEGFEALSGTYNKIEGDLIYVLSTYSDLKVLKIEKYL